MNHTPEHEERAPKQEMQSLKQKKQKKGMPVAVKVLLSVVFGFMLLLSALLVRLSIWYNETFDIDFTGLLATLLTPIEGTAQETMAGIIEPLIPVAIIALLVIVPAAIFLWCFRKWSERTMRILRRVTAVFCAVALLVTTVVALLVFKIPAYIAKSIGTTDIYEQYYVDPDDVRITDADGNAQNLIYIYLESMETTYLPKDMGGSQDETNYIPRLSALAQENITFSDEEDGKLGGFYSIDGTSWTMGALMGTTSGVPFALSVFGEKSHNSLGKDGTFVDGLVTLGDVLEEKGYRQEFLCGSKGSFAGRETYFNNHGGYEVFDYGDAMDAGYIEEGYFVWWGYEDAILFDVAKDRVSALAASDEPFNFTMLTVDAHHVGGYVCSECGDTYETGLENVLACTDRLVGEFIDWCEQQPFYENTTIIITGDHPRMDKQLLGGAAYEERLIYNCFINSVAEPAKTNGRTFTSLDMFPTVLAAMGFEVEGNKLGLGTNLFSTVPTLAEQKGIKWLDTELGKYSDYYVKNFCTTDGE